MVNRSLGMKEIALTPLLAGLMLALTLALSLFIAADADEPFSEEATRQHGRPAQVMVGLMP